MGEEKARERQQGGIASWILRGSSRTAEKLSRWHGVLPEVARGTMTAQEEQQAITWQRENTGLVVSPWLFIGEINARGC